MSFSPTRSNLTGLGIPGMLARYALGLTYLYTGGFKALHPVDFLKLVREYDLVHSAPALDALAALLPWFEIACGLLLVAGMAVRGTALMSLLMLVPFTAAVLHRALALKTALAISLCAVKFDCGCGTGEMLACHKLLENLLLLAVSAWLLAGGGGRGSLHYRLLKAKPGGPGA
jgi:uncharacterized membrane protein YphA (DoxX/SURF4 family)